MRAFQSASMRDQTTTKPERSANTPIHSKAYQFIFQRKRAKICPPLPICPCCITLSCALKLHRFTRLLLFPNRFIFQAGNYGAKHYKANIPFSKPEKLATHKLLNPIAQPVTKSDNVLHSIQAREAVPRETHLLTAVALAALPGDIFLS